MTAIGQKLDLSGLTDNEAEHVLQVVQRDMRLRKNEEERLSELKQELDEEGSRCLLLSQQSCFNRRCCIRCCSPFTFLLNPKRQCQDCGYNVCKACRVYSKRDEAWLCSSCQKCRLLKTQSLEWFYTNVKKRFKRFGSAKVLKTLYRKHLAEHSALSDLTEGSAYEESICNEDSICGSDSTFYRQTEEHSMGETLSVAMRVAEEAIDEAIAKAEFEPSSQVKQNEAHYLREHKAELVEELAKTIVQKIISRRKMLAEMRVDYEQDWTAERNAEHHQPPSDQPSDSLQHQSNLWRSHSAYSLLENDPPSLLQGSPQPLRKERVGSAMTAWRSVDRLDNAGVSSVLKSQDGNWIALQSAQLSHPRLLTKRKSLVYSALEAEYGVVSPYECLSSDNETKPEPEPEEELEPEEEPEPDTSWGAVLQEIHKKMTNSNFNPTNAADGIRSPVMDHRGSRDNLLSDSEGNWESNKPLLALLKRKVPAEIRKPSSTCRTSIINVNFRLEGAGGEEEEMNVTAELEVGKNRRSRKKRRSKKEPAASSVLSTKDSHSLHPSDTATPDDLTSGAMTPDPFNAHGDITGNRTNQMDEELTVKLQQLAGRVSDSLTREEKRDEGRDATNDGQKEGRRQGGKDGDEEEEGLCKMEIDVEEGRTEDEEEKEEEENDEDLKNKLFRLVAQSRLAYFSSTDGEVHKAGQSEGEWDKDEDMVEEDKEPEEGKTDGLTYKLCQLEKEARATQFSSTEDELDRIGVEVEEGEEEEEEEEDGENEELAVKVCRLVHEVHATEFSSTEEELDRAGAGEEEATDEDTPWELQAEKATQAAQLQDLASLVSDSQFSSTEDELDRVGANEGETKQEVGEGRSTSGAEARAVSRRESVGDVNMKTFDLRDETEERKNESSDENVLDSRTKVEEVERDEAEEDEDRREERGTEDETTAAERFSDERRESETEVEEERPEEMKGFHQHNQPEAERPDRKEGEKKFPKESKESRSKWETAADEEDTEFDRIISSMLMMTFPDVETLQNTAGENQGGDEETAEKDKVGAEGGLGQKTAGARSTDISEETGSVSDELQSRGDGERPESAEREQQRVGEDVCVKPENRGAASRADGEGEGKLSGTTTKTNEPTLKRMKAVEEEKPDAKGQTAAGRGVADARGDTGASETKDEDRRPEETNENKADDVKTSGTSSLREDSLSPERIQNRYSAVSLSSITTEVLKVLNATEELLQGVTGGDEDRLSTTSLPPNTDPKKLDQQFSRLEENVYLAAGSVYSLEVELSELEECARGICTSTSNMELSFLEEQVAAAAAKVQQSDRQVGDISARIAALKSAGLNVDSQSRFTKSRTIPVMPITLDSSRQLRRRLPAPPVKEDKET